MSSAGFEPAIPEIKRQQTYAAAVISVALLLEELYGTR
jgi:hypothetical protein